MICDNLFGGGDCRNLECDKEKRHSSRAVSFWNGQILRKQMFPKPGVDVSVIVKECDPCISPNCTQIFPCEQVGIGKNMEGWKFLLVFWGRAEKELLRSDWFVYVFPDPISMVRFIEKGKFDGCAAFGFVQIQ